LLSAYFFVRYAFFVYFSVEYPNSIGGESMREALTRLRTAEEANEQQLLALKKELQLEEAQQQQALQERSAALEEALAQEQATIEEQLQQSLAAQKQQLAKENQQVLDRYQKNMQSFQEQAVQQIVEGVIGTYGSNQTK
jgi:F0F1-type ATP synthase membrane subunit b/b'